MSSSAKSTIFTPLLLTIILAIASLGQVAAEIYVPSLPTITRQFQTNSSLIQLTLAAYLFSFGVSHLIYGPLSDRIGRRKPIIFGISLSIFGNIICLFAPDVYILILGRFIQGFGFGVCTSVGRTLSRDLLSGAYLARVGSQMAMINSFVVASAPIIGGYVQQYLNWRINFLLIILYAVLVLILICYKLPETIQERNPLATKLNVIGKNYLIILTHPHFMGYALCATFAYSGIIAYLTTAPFLLENYAGLTPIQFGWLAFLIASVMFVSAFINSRLIISKGIPKMIIFGISFMFAGGLLMLFFMLFNLLNLAVIIIPVLVFCIGTSLTFSNAFAGAFHPFADKAGAASGIYGFIQIGFASLISSFLAGTKTHSQLPLAITLLLLGIGAALALKFLAFKKMSVFEADLAINENIV